MSKPEGSGAEDSPQPVDVPPRLSIEIVHRVRDACLCLHAQRAARALARHFDQALAPFDMTNGQFSLMMALNGLEAPQPGRVAELLAMDRTSLTAMLKPLERRGWVQVRVDERDRRARRLHLTDSGVAVLRQALEVWEREHAAIEAGLVDADALRAVLNVLAFGKKP